MNMSTHSPSVVGVGELKAHLSEYLRLVKGGRELVVTERGRAIARITSITGAEAADSRIEALIASGVVRARSRTPEPGFWRRRRHRDPAGRSLDFLLAERDEGR
jgi:prevent-host-death family protein